MTGFLFCIGPIRVPWPYITATAWKFLKQPPPTLPTKHKDITEKLKSYSKGFLYSYIVNIADICYIWIIPKTMEIKFLL